MEKFSACQIWPSQLALVPKTLAQILLARIAKNRDHGHGSLRFGREVFEREFLERGLIARARFGMLKISPSDYVALREHGEETYPHECCGVLLGRFEDDGSRTV